jgi:hypothetical protein
MSHDYLLARLMPSYSVTLQIELRLSPGDGFKGLPSSPAWF